jgi:N-succinyldiaminopimelate aminotransferase
MTQTSERLTPGLREFGTTIFSEMTKLAIEHEAINLSQGFPDFEGPDFILDAAQRALREGKNQYAPGIGVPALRESIARQNHDLYGLTYNPDTEVTVFSGATEAIFASIQSLAHPGSEVILFEPYYDSYPASVAMAGATRVCIPLSFPAFSVDFDRLRESITDRTQLIVLNTPMNPTGKVWTREELTELAAICVEHDLIVVADEVYEMLTFDGVKHIPIASIDGMRERTVMISSASKTFSVTGWKIGWACAPPELTRAIRASHQFITFCSATPFQYAVAEAINQAEAYYRDFKTLYQGKKDLLCGILKDVGFTISPPDGTYFVLADFTPFGFTDDITFCHHITRELKVAAIPPTAFYDHEEEGQFLARFAFCKSDEVLSAAGTNLKSLTRSSS